MLADDHRAGVSIILELVPKLERPSPRHCLVFVSIEAVPRLRTFELGNES